MTESSETNTLSTKKKRINRTDLAYAAAIMDGEGHFGGTLHSHGKYPEIRIGVTNTSKVLIDWFLVTFGGWVQQREPDGLRHKKTCYEWHPCGQDVDWFIQLMLPFLKIKQQQAYLMLAYRSCSYGQTEKRSRIMERIQALNR